MTMSESELEMFAKVTVEEFEDEFLAREEFLRNEREEEELHRLHAMLENSAAEVELEEMSVADLVPNV